jgi:choline-sulfatase
MKPGNLLIIMSDEHNPKIMGCSGHPVVQTPNIDALAAAGTMFTDAYTTSPVCVPARAAFAIGKYVHQIGYWDNADAYEGAIPSWHHRLREHGHYGASIGKLHFRGQEGDDYGFNEMQIPMQIIEGRGDLMGLVRNCHGRSPGLPARAKRRTPPTTGISALARKSGCAKQRRNIAIARGCCSSHSYVRIFRSLRPPSFTTAIRRSR